MNIRLLYNLYKISGNLPNLRIVLSEAEALSAFSFG